MWTSVSPWGEGPQLVPEDPETRAIAALATRVHDTYIVPIQGRVSLATSASLAWPLVTCQFVHWYQFTHPYTLAASQA